MGALGYLRMVLWSFFGIRRRAAAGAELQSMRPVPLLAVALGAAATFVMVLLGLVKLALAFL